MAEIERRNNLKVGIEGEAITSDEFLELLLTQRVKKEAENQRKESEREEQLPPDLRKSQKASYYLLAPYYIEIHVWKCLITARDIIIFLFLGTHIDVNSCYVCEIHFDDNDQQEAWIGCDSDSDKSGCWFQNWCAGFDKKPNSRRGLSVVTAEFHVICIYHIISVKHSRGTCATWYPYIISSYCISQVTLIRPFRS